MTFKIGDKVEHTYHGPGEIVYGPYSGLVATGNYLLKLPSDKHITTKADVLTLRPEFTVGDRVQSTESGNVYKLLGGPWDGTLGTFYVAENAEGMAVSVRAVNLRLAPVAPPAQVPIVGDWVRVVEDDPENYTGQYVGQVGRLADIDLGTDTALPYMIKFDENQGNPYTPWFVAKIEPATEPEPAANVPIIGDWVRVVEDDPNCCPGEFVGKVGRLVDIAPDDVPYEVAFDAGQNAPHSLFWVVGVEPAARYRDRDGDKWVTRVIDGVTRATLEEYAPAVATDFSLAELREEHGPLTAI